MSELLEIECRSCGEARGQGGLVLHPLDTLLHTHPLLGLSFYATPQVPPLPLGILSTLCPPHLRSLLSLKPHRMLFKM